MDVWVDGDGRLRRLEYEMELSDVDGARVAVGVTMELYDFGVEVDVVAPPADETTDLFELLGGVSPLGAPGA
jgi:hypothetical protein